jgi:methylase of polypeptide subunit release factors
VLKDGGFWLFEIGYDQEQATMSLAGRLGFACEVERDLGGNPRVAYIYR